MKIRYFIFWFFKKYRVEDYNFFLRVFQEKFIFLFVKVVFGDIFQVNFFILRVFLILSCCVMFLVSIFLDYGEIQIFLNCGLGIFGIKKVNFGVVYLLQFILIK